MGHCRDLHLRGSDTEDERRRLACHGLYGGEGAQPSQIPGSKSTHLFPPLGARLQEVCTPSLQQALGGPLTEDPLETPMPTVHGGGESECARASGALRKGCFPFQWGYFWLCSCSHCGNCTCPLQCGNMTSFPRMMYTKQAARKLLLIGCECASACFYPHPPPPPLSPFSLRLGCLSPEAKCGRDVFHAA